MTEGKKNNPRIQHNTTSFPSAIPLPDLDAMAHEDIREMVREMHDKSHEMGVQASSLDITERKQSEERIRHLNAVLKSFVLVNEIIFNARDRKRLLENICQALTSTRGYHNAWIVLLDGDQGVMDWAQEGLEDTFQGLLSQFRQGRMTSCAFKALKSPLPQIVSDPLTECSDCPLARLYSGRAGFSVRLEVEEQIIGLLAVSVPKELADDVEEQDLFMSLAGIIAQGIQRMRLEEIRFSQEHRLQNYERIISRVSDPMSLVDTDYRYIVVNDAYLRAYNKSRQEIEGHTVADLLGRNIFLNQVKPHMDMALAGREVVYEDCFPGPDGLPEYRIMNYYPSHDEDRLTGVVVRALDITGRKRTEQQTELRFKLISYASGHSLTELMKKALDEVEHLLNSAISFLHFVGPEQKSLTLQQWSTATEERYCKAPGKGLHYSIEQAGVWVDCVRERKGLIHNDYASLPNRKGLPEGHAALIREMVVPVMRQGVIVAIMGVGNKPVDYTQEDLSALSYLADVTWEVIAHKQMAEALIASEETHRRLFETMAQGVIYQEADGTIVSANPAAEKILGLSFDQMRGKTSVDPRWKMIKEDGSAVPGIEHPTIMALLTGQTVGPVTRGVFHAGKNAYIWLSITAIPLFRDGETAPFQAYATFTDITKRKQAEYNLRQRESLLQRIFDILPIGLWFADKNGRLLRGNPAGVQIWGAEPLVDPFEYGVFKARRYPSREEITPDTWALARTVQEGATILDELLEIDAFDGTKKIILNSTAPVFNEKGDIEGAVVINQDVTEREKLQAQLLQAHKMESVGRLAGGVAHDFNNKLAIINGFAEMALDMIDPSDSLHESLVEIHTAGRQSADIVRQLLAFARQQTISPSLLDLNDTISSMLKMLQRLIGENIDLAWHPAQNLWPVKIDPTQLDQVMANLAVNARDAIADVGKLTIETKNVFFDADYTRTHAGFTQGHYVMLAVSDDGSGMDKETLGNLFEPFFTTKEIGKGTGLGLSMIYGIVKQNYGFINVYSEPGEGTTFKIYLPSHETEKSALHSAKASSREMLTGTESILIVEDEKAILQMARRMLEKLGYTVHTAGNPSEAFRFSEDYDGSIHLLITDVVMPGMNGRDLSYQLIKKYPGLKVLYMSGYTANVIAHHGVLDEGVQFIQKPFAMIDLAIKVREALEQ